MRLIPLTIVAFLLANPLLLTGLLGAASAVVA